MTEDFAELLASYEEGRETSLQKGNKVSGTVISIGESAIFVDCGAAVDGIVDRDELLDEEGNLTVAEGDSIDLYVIALSDDSVRLSRALTGIGGLEMLEDAFVSKVPVEGRVMGTIKGGFQVEVLKRRAFCPVSQIDTRYVDAPEDYIGQTLSFRIIKLTEGGRNIVLSRRALLEEEQEQASAEFFAGIKPGDTLEGTVTRLVEFGAFVELVPGVEGLVHISELSWSRVQSPDEVVSVGDRVRCSYLGSAEGKKPGERKISLSMKKAQGDPWKDVAERFSEGQKVTGKVVRLMEFGVFVEIAPGVEGLVHISEMSYTKRVHKPDELVQPGDMVAVLIRQIDVERQRIALSMKDAEGDPWLTVTEKYVVGQAVTGTVEKRQPYGLFVALEPGITGLLPQSAMGRSANAAEYAKLGPGDQITVSIESVSPQERRVSLGTGKKEDVVDWKGYKPQKSSGFSSLGAALADAMKKKDA